jgi:hypothetical protein
MKKKNNKKTIPAYAFGMDQLSNYLGGANVFGSAISGLSEEGSTGDVAGSTIGSAASLAGAGLTVGGPIGAAVGGGLGLVSGLIGSIKRKKQMQALRRRKETLNKTKIGMNAAAETEGEYWDDNDLAYTFENGGILPDLAYLDNNEVVRDDYGNIVQVPNTQPGTDNHLVDASTLESVLSDKIKRPGTKNTFAKEGQILFKMTKPSKGKDIFAENTNKLNKINANRAYNRLLAEQEAVKAAKGVKPKVKGIPAYEDGTNNRKLRWGLWNVEDVDIPQLNVLDKLFTRNAKDISADDATINRGRAGIYNPTPARYNKNAAYNTALQMGSPTTGAWFAPLQTDTNAPQGVDAVTYANDEPIPTITYSSPTVTTTPTTTSVTPSTTKPTTTKSTKASTAKPKIVKTTTERLAEPTIPLLNTSMAIDWDDAISPVNIPQSVDEATKKRAGKNAPKDKYSPDWLSLAPTVYNTLQSLRGPEEEPLALNPYAGAVRSTMARRRMNIEPARLANSRSRAISNYNLANINANTGSNLAARTQAAVDEYASNANMYATKQNADNAYLGEYANTLNNLGQQFEQSVVRYNDLNARNRAAARNFGATAASQLGKWSQVNRQMQNQYNRDQMTLPFLADFLSQGFTKEQVDNLLTRTRNRV